jgi:Flp pilus assembly pilin Flp
MTRLLHRTHSDHGWRRARRAFAQALAYALRDQTGQDLIEYGLLAGLIAVVAIGAVHLLGVEVGEWWSIIGQRIADLW